MMSSALERRYRLLLTAYPAEYLDSHEEEILGTLLEGAVPGQVRPTFGEACALVLSGLRVRSRRAASDGRAVLWADSLRLAALLVLASVLSDQVALGSQPLSLLGTVSVALSIVAVVIGAPRLGLLFVLLAAGASAIVTQGLGDILLPAAWAYDVACLVTVAIALGIIPFLAGTLRPWPWWLAAAAIAIPFLYRLFLLDVSKATVFRVPSSVFELILPVAVLSATALLLRDARPAITATVYAALHLVVPITLGVEFAQLGFYGSVGLIPFGLTAMALAASVASSRPISDDLPLVQP